MDSDLVEPIRIVRRELKLPVGILNPAPNNHPSQELRKTATFVKPIRLSVLKASQFPIELTDRDGTLHKPETL